MTSENTRGTIMSHDVYLEAARAARRSAGDFGETSAVVFSKQKSHRAAVDAARGPLLTEVERLAGVEAALRDALKGVWDNVDHLTAEVERLKVRKAAS